MRQLYHRAGGNISVPELTGQGAIQPVCIRESLPADEPFLRELFRSTREFPLNSLEFRQLADLQYEARRSAYLHRAASLPKILTLDGLPAGSLWLWTESGDVVIADIAVLPPFQRRGIATRVLSTVIADCNTQGRPLRLTVARGNATALRLYRKLGFRIIAESDTDFSMLLSPAVITEARL